MTLPPFVIQIIKAVTSAIVESAVETYIKVNQEHHVAGSAGRDALVDILRSSSDSKPDE